MTSCLVAFFMMKVVELPLSTWNYKSGQGDVRRIGPVGQDFREAFGVGHDATTISTREKLASTWPSAIKTMVDWSAFPSLERRATLLNGATGFDDNKARTVVANQALELASFGRRRFEPRLLGCGVVNASH